MKNCLTLIIALLIFGGSAIAQDGDDAPIDRKNTLKANPLGLIIGIGKINYERKLGTHSSVQLGASYFSYTSDGSGISGLGLVPEYRFYVTGDAIGGFYLAPFAKYNALTLKDNDSRGTVSWYSGGAKAGFQWIMGKKETFVMDLAFGGKYSDFNLRVKEGAESDFDNTDLFEGFSPELHFAIGFAF